jgi:hypothetical protein
MVDYRQHACGSEFSCRGWGRLLVASLSALTKQHITHPPCTTLTTPMQAPATPAPAPKAPAPTPAPAPKAPTPAPKAPTPAPAPPPAPTPGPKTPSTPTQPTTPTTPTPGTSTPPTTATGVLQCWILLVMSSTKSRCTSTMLHACILATHCQWIGMRLCVAASMCLGIRECLLELSRHIHRHKWCVFLSCPLLQAPRHQPPTQ